MSEESILILNMLREGKITAEQADSLLRAVRDTAPPPTAAPPPVAPLPPTPDPAAMASMQAKLAELQGKLGDLQGKLGAAQTVKAAGQAASLAGKVLDHIPRPELDMSKINKAVDEAMRGLNSLKNDAIRTAKTAGRQAAQEARRAAKEGRKAMRFDLNVDFGRSDGESRPVNLAGLPEASEAGHSTVTWAGADRLMVENKYGAIKIVGIETADGSVEATFIKTSWAGSDAEARVLLQQVFLTHQVENGRCKIAVAAPLDARERLTVDFEITVPRHLPLEAMTTFGDLSLHGVSSALTAKSGAGAIHLDQPFPAGGETRVTSASGRVSLHGCNLPGSALLVETTTGDIHGENLTTESLTLSSRSGDLTVHKAQASGAVSFESASGDVSITGGSSGTRALVRTQSGNARVDGLRAEQIQIETVSGDAEVRGASGALTVKTVSGDVKASAVESPAVSLLTVSGDARWVIDAPFSGSFSGTTVSGDLDLTLAGGSDARVEMNTTSGGLTLSLALSDAVITDKHAAGKIGGGVGSIRLQSVSGDLKIGEAG